MSAAWIQRALDDFNRSDENPLSGSGVWTPLHSQKLKLVNNSVQAADSIINKYYSAYYSAYPFLPNQYSKFTNDTSTLVDYQSRAVRCSPGPTYYFCQLDYGTPTTYYIGTFVNGVSLNQTTFNGRPDRRSFPIQRLIAVGNRIAMEYWTGTEWSEHSFIIDNNILAGFPGIVTYRQGATVFTIDDWSGGDDGVPVLYTGPNFVPSTAMIEMNSVNHSAYYFPSTTFDIIFPSKTITLFAGAYDANAGGGYLKKSAENILFEIVSPLQVRLSFHAEYKAGSVWNHGSMFCTAPVAGVAGGNVSNQWDVPLGETKTYYRTAYFQIIIDVNINELGISHLRGKNMRLGSKPKIQRIPKRYR